MPATPIAEGSLSNATVAEPCREDQRRTQAPVTDPGNCSAALDVRLGATPGDDGPDVAPLRVARRLAKYGSALVTIAGTYALHHGRSRIPVAREVVRQARRLGPAPIKLIQIVSTRTDLLDQEVCDVLASLAEDGSSSRTLKQPPLADASALDSESTRPGPPGYIFEPGAHHGSLASVRYARCPKGTPLAAKVMRQDDVKDLRTDLRLARYAVSMLKRCRPEAAASISPMLDAVQQQADLCHEADSLGRIATALRDRPNVIVPEVLHQISTSEALWMQRAPQPSKAAWTTGDAELAMRVAFELIFLHGLAHCDLHAGNLYFTDARKLVILDAGFVVAINQTTQSQFAEFFIAIAENDVETCVGILHETACPRAWEQVDQKRLREDLHKLLNNASRQRSGAFSLGRFGVDLMTLQVRQGLMPSPQFAFPLASLMTLEGRIRASHPSLDFQAIATRVITGAVLQGKVRKFAERPYMATAPKRV